MDNKTMSVFVFIATLFVAALFDLIGLVMFLIGMIPIVGIPFIFLEPLVSVSFIFFARLGFWLAGYRSKGTTALMVATALFELIPGLSILPGCIAFVVGFYLINKASATLSGTKLGRMALKKVEATEMRKKNREGGERKERHRREAEARRRRQEEETKRHEGVLVA